MWETVGEGVRDLGFSGVVRVVGPAGVEFEGCYGLADRARGVPVHAGTRFALASLSKMFTAATTVAVVPDLDAPVVSLLPPSRRPSTLRPDVTVRHLLTHTSNIADYAEEDGDDPVDYASLWLDRPCYRMERPADFLPLLDLPPYGPPGGDWHYCNSGFVLLALVVEELAGLEFPAAVGRHVLDPAGMTASGYFRLDDPPADTAVGYLPSGRTNVYSTPVVGGGDGGAFATAADLDRFLRWLDPALLVPQVPVAPPTGTLPGIDMGLGVLVYQDGRYGHGGGDPGVETLAHGWRGRDLTYVVLGNTEGTVDAVRTLVLAELSAG
jgi:CubicO group peptidase (beta-lactamase class C family)